MNFLIVCLAFLAVVAALRHDEPEEIARRMADRRKAHQGRKLIVGGQTINQARYPYYTLVEIEYANDEVFFCGGALVNAGCVLTSASCIGDAAISVAIGANYTTDAGFTGNEQFRSISNTVIHPQYNAATSDYDLALLFFDLPITTIQPVTINPSRPANGAALRVIGFGVIDEISQEYPLILQQGDVNVVPPGDCNDANSYNQEIRSARMLCAIGNGVVSPTHAERTRNSQDRHICVLHTNIHPRYEHVILIDLVLHTPSFLLSVLSGSHVFLVFVAFLYWSSPILAISTCTNNPITADSSQTLFHRI